MANPERSNVISMEAYRNRQERGQLLARAAYWEVKREDAWKALEVAERNREAALREAGMLPEERGVDETDRFNEEASERLVREDDRFRPDPNQYEFDYGTDHSYS